MKNHIGSKIAWVKTKQNDGPYRSQSTFSTEIPKNSPECLAALRQQEYSDVTAHVIIMIFSFMVVLEDVD